MGDAKLSTPRVEVIREGFEPFEVQTDNRDLVRFDKTRNRQRPPWPDPQQAPMMWLTFIAWSAASRQGCIPPDVTYDQWEQQVLDINSLSDDEEEDGAPFP
jgi:hypothetical protein